MRKENIELKFIEFEDIQVGDVLGLQDDDEDDYLYYQVAEITDERIIARNPQYEVYEEECKVHRQDFNKRLGLLAECKRNYKYVDCVIRAGKRIWDSVDNQILWALH